MSGILAQHRPLLIAAPTGIGHPHLTGHPKPTGVFHQNWLQTGSVALPVPVEPPRNSFRGSKACLDSRDQRTRRGPVKQSYTTYLNLPNPTFLSVLIMNPNMEFIGTLQNLGFGRLGYRRHVQEAPTWVVDKIRVPFWVA